MPTAEQESVDVVSRFVVRIDLSDDRPAHVPTLDRPNIGITQMRGQWRW